MIIASNYALHLMRTSYVIAIGSNKRHPRYGAPAQIVAAVIEALMPLARSRIISSRPIGPSQRRYANAAILIESALMPPVLLLKLKSIEHNFGRRTSGQRWSARVLDLDIILWSGGIWADKTLTIPHPDYRVRSFVLGPLCDVAPKWRDPVTRFSALQLKACLDRKRPRP
jgi:2-amino-4-hydroxy-6-hydroxymethyldihydropteridine diphosphokinase